MAVFLFDSARGDAESILFFALLILGLYFLPSILAWNKGDFGSVLAINFFLGWTLVGWVIALAWALKSEPKPTQVVVQQSAPQVNPPSELCRACGKYSPWGSRFCNSCGQPFTMGGRA